MISEDVYKKIHLGHVDLIEEKKDEAPPQSGFSPDALCGWKVNSRRANSLGSDSKRTRSTIKEWVAIRLSSSIPVLRKASYC